MRSKDLCICACFLGLREGYACAGTPVVTLARHAEGGLCTTGGAKCSSGGVLASALRVVCDVGLLWVALVVAAAGVPMGLVLSML